MSDGASHFYFQLACSSGLTVVSPKGPNGQHAGFIQALSLNLNGMPKPLDIKIGNDAGSHGADSSIFDNFRQLLGPQKCR
jgi:hypothetical protein